MIAMIVAVDEKLGIGRNNELMWHLSEDLKRFKAITTGHTVVMGKNTWLSLPFKPLKNRQNVIISTSMDNADGAILVKSIEEAIEVCKDKTTYIIGGYSIYKQMMPLADKLIVTHIYEEFEADTFFPEINPQEWTIKEEGDLLTDKTNGLEYKYVTYTRK